MEKHINVVAALQIGYSILRLIIGAVVFIVLHFVGNFVEEQEAQVLLPLVGNIVVALIILFSVPGIIAGVGLFKRKEWARILTLVLSALHLLSFPLGTAVGVYSLWALVQIENVEAFKKL